MNTNNEALFNVYAMYNDNGFSLPANFDNWDVVECSVDEDGALELRKELEDEGCFVVVEAV